MLPFIFAPLPLPTAWKTPFTGSMACLFRARHMRYGRPGRKATPESGHDVGRHQAPLNAQRELVGVVRIGHPPFQDRNFVLIEVKAVDAAITVATAGRKVENVQQRSTGQSGATGY